MKDEYDFSKATKRSKRRAVDKNAKKVATSIRLDATILSWFKTEALRLGMPTQTLMNSVLHRFAHDELIDAKQVKNTG